MKELNVQKYLRSGRTLDDLESEYFIKANCHENLVVLNYHQFDSPKTDPITMECRGLILEKYTWNIVARSFHRFFNYKESPEITGEFDISTAHILEKIDGSIITVFWYNDRWYMATRSSIEGQGKVGFLDKTFNDLFHKVTEQYPNFWVNINSDYCYVFELVSPENKVIYPYDYRALYLLTMRETEEFSEITYKKVEKEANKLGVLLPKKVKASDVDEVSNLFDGIEEGFVAVNYTQINEFGDFLRIKIKNPNYISIASLKQSCGNSLRSLLWLVISGESDEFLSYFPEYNIYIKQIKERYNEFVQEIHRMEKEILDKAKEEKTREDKKQMALKIKDHPYNEILFAMYNNKANSLNDWIEKQTKKRGEKAFAKKMLDMLGIKDIDFEV